MLTSSGKDIRLRQVSGEIRSEGGGSGPSGPKTNASGGNFQRLARKSPCDEWLIVISLPACLQATCAGSVGIQARRPSGLMRRFSCRINGEHRIGATDFD